MQSVTVHHLLGFSIPRDPGRADWRPPASLVARAGRGHVAPGRAGHRAEHSRKSAAATALEAASRPAASQPAATGEGNTQAADCSRPVGVLPAAGESASSFPSGGTAGFLAAWLIALALLLGLALLSAIWGPPRLPSPDEIARASLRTPHERANTGQY